MGKRGDMDRGADGDGDIDQVSVCSYHEGSGSSDVANQT